MNAGQPLPSEVSGAGDFARQLAQILGPAYQPADGTRIAADMLALGGALSLGRAASLASVGEAFADSASQLLTELETEYGLPASSGLTAAQRQTRLVAKVRAKFAGTVNDITAALRATDATATISEWGVAAIYADEPNANLRQATLRFTFRFTVLVALATYQSSYLMGVIAATVEQMKPVHSSYVIGVNLGFKCDDAGSPCDQDILTV